MFRQGRFYCYFVCVLAGAFSFLLQTNGNQVSSSETKATTGKSVTYFFYHRHSYPRDCKEVLDQCSARNSSGVFLIKPDGYPDPFEVYCNNSLDSGGWTVFMRRLDGSLSFSRNWTEYTEGFGFLRSEFWLGNDKLSFLTNQQRNELRIDITVSSGSTAFMTYSNFRVKDEWDNFGIVSVGEQRGNTGFLVPTCPTNMEYTLCACERTCEAPGVCRNNCQEAKRCVCPDGFFLRGSDCVRAEDCQCFSSTASKVIPTGESYVNSQCSSRCSCSESGLTCSNYQCDSNAMCTSTRDGGRCKCNSDFTGDGLNCACSTQGYLVDGSICRRPKDCDEVPRVRGYSGSGLYYVLPSNWREFQVYCNMSEGLWTVFQRRIPGSRRNFSVSWNSYKNGFGELDEDFWLGNDKIHYLRSQKNYQLRIDIIDNSNRHYRAQYNGFEIGNEGSKYRLTSLGTFSGSSGYDAMRHHLNQTFSTPDRDNDDWEGSDCYETETQRYRRDLYYHYYRYYDHYYYHYYYVYYYYYSSSEQTCELGDTVGGNCATVHEGGWWYKYRSRNSTGGCDRYGYQCCDSNCQNCDVFFSCAYSNLNGKGNGDSGETIFWHGLPGNNCGIKYTEMKIRPF